MLAFIFYGVKPTDDVVGIFPMLDVCSCFHVINNFFHKLLADFSIYDIDKGSVGCGGGGVGHNGSTNTKYIDFQHASDIV